MSSKLSIFWFRRDLRLSDNTALYHALKSKQKVQCIFIFDTDILDKLADKNDRRVNFIYDTLIALKQELEALGSSLWVLHGTPIETWKSLLEKNEIAEVFVNHDYEPYALERDKKIKELLGTKHIAFNSYKDIVIFEKDEVTKDDGLPYTVFTPYSKKWKSKLNNFYLRPYPTEKYTANLNKSAPTKVIELEEMGFVKNETFIPAMTIDKNLIQKYDTTRNYPGLLGTSRLGLFLRFGTISTRALAKLALDTNETYLNELIWRDFYHQILYHFPNVVKGSFKPAYDGIQWRNNETEFQAWCDGQTGYPIVDAGMRELNATGFMHNRSRMIVASFLCKHLLIDWQWGAQYFAQKLLDFDLAANNGGWQWAAGSGTDAAPYFRIFSPSEQTKKFDAQLTYIRKWVPEFESLQYVQPIVNHQLARERCLKVYKEALEKRM